LLVGLILGIGLSGQAATWPAFGAEDPVTTDRPALPGEPSNAATPDPADPQGTANLPQPAAGNRPRADTKDETDGDDSGNADLKELFSGQVLLLSEALRRKGVTAYPEELKGQVVLETRTGELWPIVPDWRGRAFYQDKRLRNRPVDLIAHHAAGVPYLQVLSIYTFDDHGARQITDYWCDICSIPMYEIKDCECCQGPIRLRFREKELPHDILPHQAPNLPHPTSVPGSKAAPPK
jgi:hypothetical protein